MIIAVDGPAASGKGTIARALAKALGFHYLDTGAIYRMVGLTVQRQSLDPHDQESIAAIAASLYPDSFLEADLRGEMVGGYASKVAALPKVRAAPHSIARVMDEALSNALAFGATQVLLTASVEFGRVRLSLANNGATPGDEIAANATKPFFTTRAAAGNRGLGLAIAAGLLRDQEGHLELLSRPEGGALVVITLPAVEDQQSVNLSVSAVAHAGAILIIEDEHLQELLRVSLCSISLQQSPITT